MQTSCNTECPKVLRRYYMKFKHYKGSAYQDRPLKDVSSDLYLPPSHQLDIKPQYLVLLSILILIIPSSSNFEFQNKPTPRHIRASQRSAKSAKCPSIFPLRSKQSCRIDGILIPPSLELSRTMRRKIECVSRSPLKTHGTHSHCGWPCAMHHRRKKFESCIVLPRCHVVDT